MTPDELISRRLLSPQTVESGVEDADLLRGVILPATLGASLHLASSVSISIDHAARRRSIATAPITSNPSVVDSGMIWTTPSTGVTSPARVY